MYLAAVFSSVEEAYRYIDRVYEDLRNIYGSIMRSGYGFQSLNPSLEAVFEKLGARPPEPLWGELGGTFIVYRVGETPLPREVIDRLTAWINRAMDVYSILVSALRLMVEKRVDADRVVVLFRRGIPYRVYLFKARHVPG